MSKFCLGQIDIDFKIFRLKWLFTHFFNLFLSFHDFGLKLSVIIKSFLSSLLVFFKTFIYSYYYKVCYELWPCPTLSSIIIRIKTKKYIQFF